MLSAVLGANINDVYGNYTIVMVFSNLVSTGREGPPMCLTLGISQDQRNIKCSCLDGKDSTLVEITALERIPITMTGAGSISTPMLTVNDANNVTSLKNVTCDCDVKIFNARNLVKNVNENYVIIYESTSDINEDRQVLLARKLPSNFELEHDITHIDEIKDKKGLRVCTREIREQYRREN